MERQCHPLLSKIQGIECPADVVSPQQRKIFPPMPVSYKSQKPMPISIGDTNRQHLHIIYCNFQNLLIKREQRKLAYYAERKKGRMKSKIKANLFCHYPQTSPPAPPQTTIGTYIHIQPTSFRRYSLKSGASLLLQDIFP